MNESNEKIRPITVINSLEKCLHAHEDKRLTNTSSSPILLAAREGHFKLITKILKILIASVIHDIAGT